MFTQILGSTYIWSLSDKINACVAIGTVALAGTAIYQLKLLRDQIKAQWIEIKSSKEAEQKHTPTIRQKTHGTSLNQFLMIKTHLMHFT